MDVALGQYPRGIACHEVGHGVVAWSFGLPVRAVRIVYSEVQGWHGHTDAGSTDHLHYMDRIAIFVAGRAAEEIFSCPAHEGTWHGDLGQIGVLLNANGIPEDTHWARISQAEDRTRQILETHRDKALKVVDRLVEYAHVGEAEFERLMGRE